MNSRTSAQDVTYCDLCKRALIKMHCETCFINLCTACVGVHMEADELFDHNIVKFHSKKSSSLYPSCASHDKRSYKVDVDQSVGPKTVRTLCHS